jgi:hypothetical protein
MPQGDEPICGYGLATGPLCHEPLVRTSDQTPTLDRPRRCRRHAGSVYEHCAGCGGATIRECPGFVGTVRCGEPLCVACEHQDLGGHAPRQTPADVALEELSAVVSLVLKEAAEKGHLTITQAEMPVVGRLIMNRLTTHVTLKVLSGLAAPPHDSHPATT